MAIESIKNLVDDIEKIKKYSHEQLAKNAFSADKPLHSSLSIGVPTPADYLSYFKTVSQKLNTPEGAAFLVQQGFLKSLNPQIGMGKLYNPGTQLLPPGMGGMITDFLDGPDANQNPGSRIAASEDRLKAMAEGRYTNVQRTSAFSVNAQINELKYDGGKNLQQIKDENNLYTVENNTTNTDYYDNFHWDETGKPGRKTVTPFGVPYDVPDFEKMFEKNPVGPGFKSEQRGKDFFKPKTQNRKAVSGETNLLRGSLDNLDTYTDAEDFKKGYSELQYEDDAYHVPFYFEDLRKPERRIFFRAFINNFSEQFIPKWMEEEYFGRVDAVASYKNTQRKVNLSFKIMPTSPPGFTAAWRKINNFIKMCYPTYHNGSMVKSPIIRMRLGDVISAQGDVGPVGLPGYIDSLEFNYTDAIWETEIYSGMTEGIQLGKAPMKIEVNFSFKIIHENNPGLDANYNFDFSQFRRIGALTDDIQNFNVENNPSEEQIVQPEDEET